jgi:hypothetical protein
VAATLVWQSASAAFSDSTKTTTLAVTTGTVAFSDDDAGAVMFSASGLRPGASQTRCITVTSTGSVRSVAAAGIFDRVLTADEGTAQYTAGR